jgi:tetratricopeptide (TPR) repeat protein
MRIAVCFIAGLAGVALNAQELPGSCDAGLTSFRNHDVSKAQEALWDCVRSGRGANLHAEYLAQTYRELKNYESGLAAAEPELKTHPDNVDLLYLAAYLRYRRNETKDSMILVSKAYRLAPKDWRLHQLFALNYISFAMLEPAKLSLLQAIQLNSTNAELHYQLARLYFNLGSYVESIKESQQALSIFPDYPEAHHNLALSYQGSGNTELAVSSFEKAVALNTRLRRKDEAPLIDFAVYRRLLGSPEASLPLLREALEINPRSAKANYEMGELLRDLKRYEEAGKYLELAVTLDPCDPRALYSLAMVSRLLGNAGQSIAMLERFKKANARGKNTAGAGGSLPCS